jgi:hypothetical protein
LKLPIAFQQAMIDGARDANHVSGLTHDFYKYPARFSPSFARAAIETFTRPGDLVLDPHVGGGTTVVEARALGREAVGIDINPIAEFVARVKSTVYSLAEQKALTLWAVCVPYNIDIHRPSVQFTEYADLGYYKHLEHRSRWRLRKGIEQALASAIGLGTPRLEALHEFRVAVHASGPRQSVRVLNRSAAGLQDEPALRGIRAPRLVVTSPPYPGVHVLYHRWQVDGRKEAPLPFLIANKLDGAGSSYYTMGDRKYPELKTYFDNIRATMSSVAALADSRTVVVQMVAFSEPAWQLPRYLETLEEAGLREVLLSALRRQGDGRLWRSVPNRRWYNDQRGETPASQEVVLIHRKARGAP